MPHLHPPTVLLNDVRNAALSSPTHRSINIIAADHKENITPANTFVVNICLVSPSLGDGNVFGWLRVDPTHAVVTFFFYINHFYISGDLIDC